MGRIAKSVTGRDSYFLVYEGEETSPGGFTNTATGNQYILLTGEETVDIFNLFHENAHNMPALLQAVYDLLKEGDISQEEYRLYLLARAQRTGVRVMGHESVSQLEQLLGGKGYVQEEFACDLFGIVGNSFNRDMDKNALTRLWRQYGMRAGTDTVIQNAIEGVFEKGGIGELSEEDMLSLTRKGSKEKESGYRFSVSKAEGGKPVAVLEEDILKGVPKSQWAKAAKEALRERFPNGVRVANSDIQINRNTRAEFAYSKDSQWLKRNDGSRYADKMRSTSIMDDILKASRDYVNEAPMHPRKDDLVDFARGKVLLQLGNNQYEAEVIVGLNKKGEMELHDIINLADTQFKLMHNKKSPSKTTGATLTASDRAGAFDGDNISNARPSVKPENEISKKNVKISKEEGLKWSLNAPVSQETDEKYLSAVKRRDRRTANRLVKEAAEAAFPDSKIRGEDEKLLIVYHGTGASFTVFDRRESRPSMDLQGNYFSLYRDEAAGYGDRVRAFYLNIQNPASQDHAYSVFRQYKGRENAGVMATEELIQQGYDGVIRDEDEGLEEYIAFYPEQIKSADPITYDESGKVIPLSERFNERKGDFRFSANAPVIQGIRQQLTEASDRLKDEPAVATVESNFRPRVNGHANTSLMKKELAEVYAKNRTVDRQGVGTVLFDEEAISQIVSYIDTDGEYAAAKIAPAIVKKGKVIHTRENHKGRTGVNTVTLAGRASINGADTYVAVVLKMTKKNRPHAVRVLTETGEAFKLPKKEEAPRNGKGTTQKSVAHSTQRQDASNPNIASTQNAVNRFSENAPKEVNIAAATLGIKPKEAVSKGELKERLQDQHTLDVGMRGMEVRSAKAAEREKARI